MYLCCSMKLFCQKHRNLFNLLGFSYLPYFFKWFFCDTIGSSGCHRDCNRNKQTRSCHFAIWGQRGSTGSSMRDKGTRVILSLQSRHHFSSYIFLVMPCFCGNSSCMLSGGQSIRCCQLALSNKRFAFEMTGWKFVSVLPAAEVFCACCLQTNGHSTLGPCSRSAVKSQPY